MVALSARLLASPPLLLLLLLHVDSTAAAGPPPPALDGSTAALPAGAGQLVLNASNVPKSGTGVTVLLRTAAPTGVSQPTATVHSVVDRPGGPSGARLVTLKVTGLYNFHVGPMRAALTVTTRFVNTTTPFVQVAEVVPAPLLYTTAENQLSSSVRALAVFGEQLGNSGKGDVTTMELSAGPEATPTIVAAEVVKALDLFMIVHLDSLSNRLIGPIRARVTVNGLPSAWAVIGKIRVGRVDVDENVTLLQESVTGERVMTFGLQESRQPPENLVGKDPGTGAKRVGKLGLTFKEEQLFQVRDPFISFRSHWACCSSCWV